MCGNPWPEIWLQWPLTLLGLRLCHISGEACEIPRQKCKQTASLSHSTRLACYLFSRMRGNPWPDIWLQQPLTLLDQRLCHLSNTARGKPRPERPCQAGPRQRWGMEWPHCLGRRPGSRWSGPSTAICTAAVSPAQTQNHHCTLFCPSLLCQTSQRDVTQMWHMGACGGVKSGIPEKFIMFQTAKSAGLDPWVYPAVWRVVIRHHSLLVLKIWQKNFQQQVQYLTSTHGDSKWLHILFASCSTFIPLFISFWQTQNILVSMKGSHPL